MKHLIESMQGFFDRLQPREKLFLCLGGAVVSVVVLVKVLLPLWQGYDQLVQQKQFLQADLSWLQAQRDIVSKMNNGCVPQRLQQQSSKEILSQLARRNQMQIDSVVDGGDKFVLRARGEDSNRILQLSYQIACYGFLIDKMQINTTENSLSYSVDLEVSRVN